MSAGAPEVSARPSVLRPLVTATLVCAIVTVLSWRLPARHAATGVGLGFLVATWWLVLRAEGADAGHYGLSMGGLFDPTPIAPRRLVRSLAIAALWALGAAALIFPCFVVGFRAYGAARGLGYGAYHFVLPPDFADLVAGQIFVIALPEEAFFRGYLQTALDDVFGARVRVFGAAIGPSLFVTSAIFAVGHVLTEPHLGRLAVFFPALVFGWLRARTRDITAGVLFHASCNVLVKVLEAGFAHHR